jgi:hypothetical protein
MSGPDKLDRLLHEWESVASTAKAPDRDPRRSTQSTGAMPASMLLVAALAVAVIAILGRTSPGPNVGMSPGPDASGVVAGDPRAPVEGVADNGVLRLTLRADHGTYFDGESIEAEAVAEYVGDRAVYEYEVGGTTPIQFSVAEVGGTRSAEGTSERLLLLHGQLEPGVPETYAWVRDGSRADTNPNKPFVDWYLDQDEFRLPVGTWELSAIFAGAQTAKVTITVEPATAAPDPTDEPAPTATPFVADAVDEDGRFRVELTSNGMTFEEGQTIRAGAAVTFLGPEGSLEVAHASPAMTFAVEEVGGAGRSIDPGADMMCLRSTFVRDRAVSFPWQRGGSYSPDNPTPNDLFNKAYMEGWDGAEPGELRLPVGTWRLSALFDVNEGGCGRTETRTASIVIRVDPAPGSATAGPHAPTVRVGPVVVCDRVSLEDCEHALALLDNQAAGAGAPYAAADFVLVADTCTPGALCDRLYPFEVAVMYATRATHGTGEPMLAYNTEPAYVVRGTDGPREAISGEGIVAPWMRALIDTAAQTRIPVPVTDPRNPRAQGFCRLAALEGTVVEDSVLGLAVSGDDPSGTPVIWPWGFSRDDAAGPALVDATGEVIAVVGDRISASGGLDDSGAFRICSFDS